MAMNREDILNSLSEPYGSLDQTLRARAEALAIEDPEVRAALAFSRNLARIPVEQLFGDPPSSDAVFLTQVRARLDSHANTKAARGVSGARLFAIATAACVLLVAGIYVGGNQSGSPLWESADLYSEFEVLDQGIWADIGELAGVGADELAAALNLNDDSEFWDEGYDPNEPISDEFLELTPAEMEEVLRQLETESFFATGNITHEG